MRLGVWGDGWDPGGGLSGVKFGLAWRVQGTRGVRTVAGIERELTTHPMFKCTWPITVRFENTGLSLDLHVLKLSLQITSKALEDGLVVTFDPA